MLKLKLNEKIKAKPKFVDSGNLNKYKKRMLSEQDIKWLKQQQTKVGGEK